MHHWRMMMIFRDKWNHDTVQQTNSGTFDQYSPAVENTLISCLFACQCMLANCRANTRRPVWSTVLHIAMPIELCITYLEMWVFAHTRLAIVSGPLMPCSQTICIDFFIRCTFSSNFFIQSLKMSDAFHKPWFFLNYSMLLCGDLMQ